MVLNSEIMNSTSVVHGYPSIILFFNGMEQAKIYLITEKNHAIVPDICTEDVAKELVSREYSPDYVFLTHEHVDHLGAECIEGTVPGN